MAFETRIVSAGLLELTQTRPLLPSTTSYACPKDTKRGNYLGNRLGQEAGQDVQGVVQVHRAHLGRLCFVDADTICIAAHKQNVMTRDDCAIRYEMPLTLKNIGRGSHRAVVRK